MAKREATNGKGKGAGKTKPGLSSNIVSLAGKRGAKGKGAVPDKSNSGQPIAVEGLQVVGKRDEEAFILWQGKIEKQWKQVQKAKAIVASETGSLNEIVGNAKESGIPASRLSVLKKRLKLESRPAGDVAAEHHEMAWQASVTNSPLVQLGLFDLKEPSPEGYELLGDKAGYSGEPMDNAPGKPGQPKHASWVSGWKRGQKRLSEETFNPGAKTGDEAEAQS